MNTTALNFSFVKDDERLHLTYNQTVLGTAHLVRLAFEKKNLQSIWQDLRTRILTDPYDAAALLDLSVILQISGQEENALNVQSAALELCNTYWVQGKYKGGLRVLVLMAPGNLMSNTPIEFLLEHSDYKIIYHYIDQHMKAISCIPEHDVVFMAISECEKNHQILQNAQLLLRNWHRPIVNNHPEEISHLTRDKVADKFHQSHHVRTPETFQIARGDIMSNHFKKFHAIIADWSLPILVRPIGAHAGMGLEKIETSSQIASYLAAHNADQFYLCPYIDYQSEDHLFRKYRIAFINQIPYPSHLAISDHWMVHYLNADMASHEKRRHEEESWFENFADFMTRYEAALKEICTLIPLDYFVIDCATLSDGRILLFEADTGMIVHNLDPDDLYPYKKTAMKKLFWAFQNFLEETANVAKIPVLEKVSPTPTFLLN